MCVLEDRVLIKRDNAKSLLDFPVRCAAHRLSLERVVGRDGVTTDHTVTSRRWSVSAHVDAAGRFDTIAAAPRGVTRLVRIVSDSQWGRTVTLAPAWAYDVIIRFDGRMTARTVLATIETASRSACSESELTWLLVRLSEVGALVFDTTMASQPQASATVAAAV
jgi:hypothetical protein